MLLLKVYDLDREGKWLPVFNMVRLDGSLGAVEQFGVERRWTVKAEYLSPRYATPAEELATVRT